MKHREDQVEAQTFYKSLHSHHVYESMTFILKRLGERLQVKLHGHILGM